MQTAGAPYRLLVLNGDGTLVDWERRVSPETLRALEAAQASGIRAMLATGRMYARALPYAEKIGAKAPSSCIMGPGSGSGRPVIPVLSPSFSVAPRRHGDLRGETV